MVPAAPPRSRLSATAVIVVIALLPLAVGAGLWLWGDHQSGAAGTLSSAPSCTETGQRNCIATVQVTSRRAWVRVSCSGRTASCIDIPMLTVLFPDGHAQDLRLAADHLPGREFDAGQRLTVGVYNGTVETVEGPDGTKIETYVNPAVQSSVYHKYAVIIAGSALPLLLLAMFLTMRSGSRPRMDAVAAYE